MPNPSISYAAYMLGRRGGKSKSPAKVAASRANGATPRPASKRKGWPKGKKREPRYKGPLADMERI